MKSEVYHSKYSILKHLYKDEKGESLVSFRDKLSAATSMFGTLLGAGFAGGAAYTIFFLAPAGKYGPWTSLFGLVVLFLCFYIGLEVARLYGVDSYENLYRLIYGKANAILWPFMEASFLAYMIITVIEVLAGGASFVMQVFGLPGIVGSVVMCILSLIVAYMGKEFFAKLATVMGVVMFIMLLCINIVGLMGYGSENYPASIVSGWVPENASAFNMLKTSMNLYASCIAMIPVWMLYQKKFKSQKDTVSSLGLGFLFSAAILVLPVALLIRFLPNVLTIDLPVLWILTDIYKFPPATVIYFILLFLALLSTGCAIFVIVRERGERFVDKRIKTDNVFVRSALIPLLIAIIAVPCSTSGILALLAVVTPIQGTLTIFALLLPLVIRGPWLMIKAKKRGLTAKAADPEA